MTKINDDSKVRTPPRILKSKVRFEDPPKDANMSRMLLEAFSEHREKLLLLDVARTEEFTGEKLLDITTTIAGNLVERLNFKPGQVAFMSCDHSGPEMLAVLSLVVAGGALFGSNIDDGYDEDRMLCQLVEPDILVCMSRCHLAMKKLRSKLSPERQSARIIWLDNPLTNSTDQDLNKKIKSTIEQDQVILLDDLQVKHKTSEEYLKIAREIAYEKIQPKEHVLTFMLTSGSTGRPKVVSSTHEELMYGLYGLISATKYPPIHEDDSNNNNNNNNNCDTMINNNHALDPITGKSHFLLPIEADNIFSGDLPMDHGAGVNTMFLCVNRGIKYVIMASYQVDIFWQSVHDYRITSSIASTTFAYELFKRLKELIDRGETNKWDLSSLRFIACCGSKMAFIDLINDVKRVYKNINVCQAYGATEIGFISMLPIEDCHSHLESVGYLFPGLVGKVVDETSGSSLSGERLCGPETRGQLYVWGPSKFKQYMCHPDDDPKLMIERCHDQDGFYMTGDQVHYDHRERLYIHGRIKDTLFLMTDWKILPEELEVVINTHPLVEYSVVVGIPDKDLPGCDAPKAFIKLIEPRKSPKYNKLIEDEKTNRQLVDRLIKRDNDEFICKDIYEFMAKRTAQPKHLKGGVKILDEFPRVGLLNKIDRNVLKKMMD